MTFTPYTTAALAWIRKGATAGDLGWDDLFYRSVCRKHSIPPNVSFPKTQAAPEIAEAPPISPEPIRDGECVFDLRTMNLMRGGVVKTLTPRLGKLFCILATLPQGSRITGHLLADRQGIGSTNISTYVNSLREAIQPLGIFVKGHQGRQNAGYELLDDKTRGWIEIRIVGASQ